MRHLVAGGSGFIGSHLIDHLMAEDAAQVICVDNFQTGSKANVAPWLNHPRFELIRHDVTEPLRIEVDRVWHLACPASPIHYQANPISTIKVNMLGTLNMLGLAKRCGARFLLASTSEVYGDPQVSPQSETYLGNVNCTGPRACYDEGKRIAETLAFDYLRVHGLQVRVARIFNTYGPRMSPTDGRVVTNFIHQALRAKPLTVYGDGSQTRSFCYVDDLVAGLQALMDSSCLHPVNLGNPAEITVAQLAQQVIAKLNPHLAVSFRPLPVDDPRQRRPDISRAQRELGWLPKVSLDDGLNRMVASIKHGQSTQFTKTEMAAPV